MAQSFNKSDLSAHHVFGIRLPTTGAKKEIQVMYEVFKELLVTLEKQDLLRKTD